MLRPIACLNLWTSLSDPESTIGYTGHGTLPMCSQFRFVLLTIGHIALASVSGDVYTAIGERLKKAPPLSATVVVTHCKGSSGYIPREEGSKRTSYEVQVSHLKSGCAEEAIVRRLLEMIGKP